MKKFRAFQIDNIKEKISTRFCDLELDDDGFENLMKETLKKSKKKVIIAK